MFQEGECRDGIYTRHLRGCSNTMQDEVHLCTCKDHLEYFWGPLSGKEDYGTTSQPDCMSSSDIINFKAHVEADRVPGAIKVRYLVSDPPNARPQSSIRPLSACASHSRTERVLLGNLKESFSRGEHRSGHAA